MSKHIIGGDLKFRAWDQFNEGFHYSHTFNNLARFFTEIEKMSQAGNGITLDRFSYRQDKEGFDIYERDIILYQVFYCQSVAKASGIAGEKIVNLVAWSDISMNLSFYGVQENTDKHKIIGNIHMNPEMMEVRKCLESEDWK